MRRRELTEDRERPLPAESARRLLEEDGDRSARVLGFLGS